MKKRSWWWGLCGLLVLAMVLAPGLAQADDLTVTSGETYDNPDGTSAYDNGFINGTANCNQGNLTFLTPGQGALGLGTTSKDSGIFNLNVASPYTGSLAADWEYIGVSGSGTFTQSGGTHTVNHTLYLGFDSGSTGTYNLSGTGSLSAGQEVIGDFGSGTFTQSGGTNTVNNSTLYLGFFSGSTGTYNLQAGSLAAGTINLNTGGLFNQTGGTLAFTTFNQSDGTGTFTDLSLGRNAGDSSTYNLSGGSLAADWEVIGVSGTGTFTQIGGTHTVTGTLILAEDIGSSGTYNLQAGSLAAGTINLNAGGLFNQTGGTLAFTTFNQSGGTGTFTDLSLGKNAGDSSTYNLSGTGSLSAFDVIIGGFGTGTFNQSGGSLTADIEYVGDSGTGTFTQTGGTNTVTGALTLGSSGTYELSGGSLTATDEYVNGSGTTFFTQTGGTNIVNHILTLGDSSGSTGTYELSGTGSVTAYGEGEWVGYNGSGTFTQKGGTNTINSALYLGYLNGSSGTYNLQEGSISADWEVTGLYGTGTFTQSGGTHTANDPLYLGFSPGSTGTYNLQAGSLAANREYIGVSGSGTFTQSGGTHTVTNPLYLGYLNGSRGTYNLQAGSLAADWEVIGFSGSGTFTQSGGTHTVTNTLHLGYLNGSTGTYNLQAGSLAAGTINLYSRGVFNQTGGSLNATFINQEGGEVRGYLENLGAFTYDSGTFSGRLLNYGSVIFNSDFTAGDGLANYSATPVTIAAGRTVTLNGFGLDNQGSLVVNGTLAGNGPLVNNTTGTLTGTGTVHGSLINRGNLSPGNSAGPLNVTSSYTQTASGTLTVDIASATNYDKLKVTGPASLAGTVKAVLQGGYVPAANQIFSGVISATNGITGSFAAVEVPNLSSTLFLEPIYTANNFNLVVQRNYTAPSLGLNANENQVGAMLNSVAHTATGDLNTVLSAIDDLSSPSAVHNVYKQISPEKAGALSTLSFAVSHSEIRNLAQRISNLRFGAGAAETALGPGAFNLSYSRLAGLMLAYNSSNLAGLITGRQTVPSESRYGLFLEPNMILGSQTTTANQTGFDFTIGGFTMGGDLRVRQNLVVGLATGYSHTGASFRGSGGGVENNTWPVMAYVAYIPQNFYAFGSLGYSLNLFNLERNIVYGGINRTAASSPTGNQLNAYGESGYDFKWKPLVVTPTVSVAYSHLWLDSYTESGAGALDLQVGSQSAASLQTGLGGKVSLPLQRDSVLVVPQVYATWQHEFSDDSRGLDARLSQGSSTFAWLTNQPHRDFAVVGADLTLSKKNFAVQLDYNAEVGRGNYTAHTVSAGLRLRF